MNEDGNNSIDIALENNQLRSVSLMIDYIVKNQNTYVYSFLFHKNFVDLVNRGIPVTSLLESRIFNREFDYDEWPSQSPNMLKQLGPYNNSMFKLRFEYPNLFNKMWK